MNEQKKLQVLIPHWIEHNQEHAQEFQRWAEQAGEAAAEIQKAAQQMTRVNETLQKALDTLGGPLEAHHHHHPGPHDPK